jgi:hypothetical protein
VLQRKEIGKRLETKERKKERKKDKKKERKTETYKISTITTPNAYTSLLTLY